jgi:DNA-binding SARP family transcriptional activator/outer membrane protein assembly factor BamB
VEFRVLGPLEVAENGHLLEVRGTKERTLLAVLLLHANETVPTERLVDELWGEQPPKSGARLVSTYVWQLRKSLGDAIVTRAPGYAAVVAAENLDSACFEQLVRRAQGLEPPAAAAALREALALWRGPALEGLRFASLAGQEVAQLEDRRLAALERRIDADLSLGRHDDVLSELQALAVAHPYREHVHAQLMLALYRGGRQAEALAAYRDVRRRLVDDLGIEPGPELQRLERSILAQDPALEAPAGGASRPPRRRRALLLTGLAAAVLLVAALIGVAVTRGEAKPVAVGPNAVAVVDPSTGTVVAGIPVGSEPGAVVSGTDAVWAANFADRNVSRIDPRARRALGTIPVDGSPTALAQWRRTLWVISRFERTVTTIDLEFDASRATQLPIAGATFHDPRVRRPTSATALRGRAFIGSTDGALLDAQGKVVATVAFPTPDLAATPDSLWLVGVSRRPLPSEATTPGVVYRLDPATGAVESETTVGRSPNGIAVGLGAVWVVNTVDATLERLDQATGASIETIRLGDPPIGLGPVFDPQGIRGGGGIAVGEGAVWVADGRRNALVRYEPASRRITRIPLDAAPADVAVGHGLVWVTLRSKG